MICKRFIHNNILFLKTLFIKKYFLIVLNSKNYVVNLFFKCHQQQTTPKQIATIC